MVCPVRVRNGVYSPLLLPPSTRLSHASSRPVHRPGRTRRGDFDVGACKPLFLYHPAFRGNVRCLSAVVSSSRQPRNSIPPHMASRADLRLAVSVRRGAAQTDAGWGGREESPSTLGYQNGSRSDRRKGGPDSTLTWDGWQRRHATSFTAWPSIPACCFPPLTQGHARDGGVGQVGVWARH